jgi:hypothetical protein
LALEGKGFYLWQIRRTEGGNATAIANVAVQDGLTHVLIKIAEGDRATTSIHHRRRPCAAGAECFA